MRNKLLGIYDEKQKNNLFWLLIISFALFRIWLMSGMSVTMAGSSPHDNMLLVNYSNSMLSLDWLGTYSSYTLIKRISYSVFMAVCKALNIPYLAGLGIFWVMAVIILIIALRKIIKSRKWLLFIYFMILFSPSMFSSIYAQRIYRMAVIPPAVVLLIACIIGMYTRRNDGIKKLMGWSLGTSISLAYFWHIREDSIWILPFIIGAAIITIIMIFIKYKKERRNILLRSSFIILPFVFLFLFNNFISLINYSKYGIYAISDLDDTYFSRMISSIYNIEQDEEIEYVWVNRSTVEKLYEVSPTLASIREEFDAMYVGGWQVWGTGRDDGEIEGTYFFWALRDAMTNAGYYTDAVETNNFCKNVYEEIQDAFKNGTLEKNKGMGISSLVRNWEPGYLGLLLEKMGENIEESITYSKMNNEISESGGDIYNLRKTEELVGSRVFYPTNGEVQDPAKISSPVYFVNSNISNGIINIYKFTGRFIGILGILSYIALTIYMIVNTFKKRDNRFDYWIIATGVLVSFLVVVGGVSYTYIEAWNSDSRYSYLAAIYPLQHIFIGLVIVGISKPIVDFSRRLIKNKK